MSQLRLAADGRFPPEAFVRALTDFGPDRERVWAKSSGGQLIIHELGDTWADVTEGTNTGGVWQRYRYDWSMPSLIRLTVIDSNVFGEGSYWEYRLTPLEANDTPRTRIDLVINRVPTTVRGKVFEPLLRLIGRQYFGRDLRRTVRQIERLG
jgi:hypothetical protein